MDQNQSEKQKEKISKLEDSKNNNEGQQSKNKLRVKSKLIKKKTIVPILINFPYMFKLSDSIFHILKQANIQAFQDISHVPEVFYCKTLKNVKFQTQNTILKFKTIKKNFQSVEKYIQEFKSFGDEYFYDLAVSYQFIYSQYNMFSRFKPDNVSKTAHLDILEDLLIKLQGKRFLGYIMENVQDQTCLDRIIISNTLLKELGYTKEDIQLDYLKYKHVFFEIVNKQFFQRVYIELGHYAKKMIQKNVELAPKYQDNPHKKNLVIFNDFVYRKKVTQDGLVDEKLNAVIQFYKPHPKITMFEFQIDFQTILQIIPRYKEVNLKQRLQEQIQKEQIQSLSAILQNLVLPSTNIYNNNFTNQQE